MMSDLIRTHLCEHGITVHLATPDSSGVVTVFLEPDLGQAEYADSLMRRHPAVQKSERLGVAILRITLR